MNKTRVAPSSASVLAIVSSVSPKTIATGSPSLRAKVRSSSAGLEGCESTCSATISTSDINNRDLSDVFASSQELDQGRRSGAIFIGDDATRLLGRSWGGLHHLAQCSL